MYDRGPSDAELEAIGIKREDVQDNSITGVWPENWVAFQVFSEISSQWRMGPAGRTGLDYNVAFQFLDLLRVKKSKRLEVIRDVRVLEREALHQMNKD